MVFAEQLDLIAVLGRPVTDKFGNTFRAQGHVGVHIKFYNGMIVRALVGTASSQRASRHPNV
jgi:hypothetical protein